MPSVNALISPADPEPETNEETNTEPEINQEPEESTDPVEESTTPAKPELTPLQAVAASMGWKPKDEWKGDVSGWVSEQEYLSALPKYIARLQEHNRQSKRELERVSERQNRLERTSHAMRDAEIARVRAEYEDAKFRAAESGDADLYKRLNDEQTKVEDTYRQNMPAAPEDDTDTMAARALADPALNRFYQTHAWILEGEDDTPYNYAVHVANDAMARGANQIQAIAAAEQALVYAYPQMYQRRAPTNGNGVDPNRQRQAQGQPRDPAGKFVAEVHAQRRAAAPVASGKTASAKDGGVGGLISKLDPVAKAEMDREVARGHKAEDWLKIYHGVNDLKEVRQ